MKKINILFYISVSLLVSCSKLDESPKAFVVKEQFFKTQADAVSAVTAVYSGLTEDIPGEQPLYGRNLYFLTDMGTDYAAAGPSAVNPNVRSISALTYTPTNDRVQAVWRQLYSGINRANIAIDHIPLVTADDAIKQRLIREAKFLRALYYFNAVRLWGAVPLVLHEPVSLNLEVLKVGRTPVDEVYAQIINDLKDAEGLPPGFSGADIGRATAGAAKALLAKVYLTRKDWPNAIIKAREVVQGSYGYALFENFSDLYTPAKKNGKEHIFSAQFEPNTTAPGGVGNVFMGSAFPGFSGNAPGDIPADNTLYASYPSGDTRRDVSFYTVLTNPATGLPHTFPQPYFGKYVDRSILSTPYQLAMNFPILRYADVLLILAEGLNEKSNNPDDEAYNAINQVRRRAFGKPVNTPDATVDLAGLTGANFRKAIQQERKWEFVQESQRWFDLVRWETLVTEVSKVPAKKAVTARNLLYPIPQNEVNLNPKGLYQNPDYN